MANKALRHHIAYEIATRYSTFQRDKDGSSNLIIDSYVPHAYIKNMLNHRQPDFTGTSYTLSEFFSEEFGVREMPIEMACEVLGFNKTEIKRLLIAVKKQKLNMVFTGFGGTGTNTAHWLSKLLVWTGQVNLFQNVAVYDKDKVETSNLLRIPFSTKHMADTRGFKVDMFSNYGRLSAREPEIRNQKLEFKWTRNPSYGRQSWEEDDRHSRRVTNPDYVEGSRVTNQRFPDFSEYKMRPKENTFFYGAPDLDSRENFKELKFISATHGDDECSLIIKPLIDTSLQIESYGLIRLSAFFMNQLRMAIALLEFLAADDDTKWDTPAEEVFLFNFKDYIQAGNGTVRDKKLTWQLDHDGVVILPEEVA